MKYIIDALTEETVPPLKSGWSTIFPWKWILVYGGITFGSSFADQIRDIIFAKVMAQIELEMASEVFQHLLKLSLEFHLNRRTGAVLRSVSRGAVSFSVVLRICLFMLFPVVLQVLVVCIYLAIDYEWYFSVITFAVIVVYVFYTFKTTEWRNKFRRVMNEKDNEFNQKGSDALLNIETIKSYGTEKHESRRYNSSLVEYRNASIVSTQSLSILNAGQQFIISLGVTAVMILGGMLVRDGIYTAGDFILVRGFIMTIYSPLGFLGTYYRMVKQNIVDVESVFSILEEKEDIVDKKEAKIFEFQNGKIEFADVTFKYPKSERLILKGISFTIEKGQKVAVVGPTGAGKSTISRLLYRFYDPTSGKILIDDQDLHDVNRNSFRKHIAMVPQDCVLFNDTIGYNIGYGCAGIDQENPNVATQDQIEKAAEAASLTLSIQKMEKKYDTTVGERGLKLSGGEKQRVAIARAMMKDPKIYIFDEATASLDTVTETKIQKAIDRVSSERASLTIAHRLTTVMNCDRIFVLDSGEIVEQGTHKELLSKKGLYNTLWNRQAELESIQQRMKELKQSLKTTKEGLEDEEKVEVVVVDEPVKQNQEPAEPVVNRKENDAVELAPVNKPADQDKKDI